MIKLVNLEWTFTSFPYWCMRLWNRGSSYGVKRHFQQYRGGGGNRSTRRKPPTCRKSLSNFIT